MQTVNLIQGSEEWLSYRTKKGGASEVSYLFGCNPFCSANDQKKYLIGLKLGFNTIFMNDAMRAGNDNESEIMKVIEDEFDIVTQPLIGYKNNVSASFDGITLDNDVVVEVKHSTKTYEYVKENGNPPEHYYLQVQQQLHISGAGYAIFASMHTDTRDVLHCIVKRDKDVISDIVSKWDIFFELMNSKEWIEEDFNEERDDLDWLHATENYKDALSMEREAKEAKEKAKKALIELTGGVSTKGNGVSVYNSKGRETINYKAIIKDNGIEIADKYKKQGKSSWGVRVTDK